MQISSFNNRQDDWRERNRAESDRFWSNFRADMDDTFHRRPQWQTDMDRRFADDKYRMDMARLNHGSR